MTHKIYPCIWFDGNAADAASLYTTLLPDSRITADTPMVVDFELAGVRFMGLNGGPNYKPNPTVSFYAIFGSEAALDNAWERLSEKGKIMMPIDSYEWSPRYGWVEDRFGVSWQLTLGDPSAFGQHIIPALMFAGEEFGKGGEALKYYSKVFKSSGKPFIYKYPDSDTLQAGKIAHAQFDLLGQNFILMDSGHFPDLSFTEGISIVIACESQEEIDYYWSELSQGGSEGRCGWLKDKFGFSWQVVPAILPKLMSDPKKAGDVMQAFLKMKKFEIDKLLQSAE